MRIAAALGTGVLTLAATVLAWGYWHASTHHDLHVRVEDHGLRTPQRRFGSPPEVEVTFRSADGSVLASARTVGQHGTIAPVHPDPAIGDCRQFEQDRRRYAACYAEQSAWVAEWVKRVDHAAVRTPACALDRVEVLKYGSAGDWWLWWVPHPHIGGTPRRYVELTVRFDSQRCVAVP